MGVKTTKKSVGSSACLECELERGLVSAVLSPNPQGQLNLRNCQACSSGMEFHRTMGQNFLHSAKGMEEKRKHFALLQIGGDPRLVMTLPQAWKPLGQAKWKTSKESAVQSKRFPNQKIFRHLPWFGFMCMHAYRYTYMQRAEDNVSCQLLCHRIFQSPEARQLGQTSWPVYPRE